MPRCNQSGGAKRGRGKCKRTRRVCTKRRGQKKKTCRRVCVRNRRSRRAGAPAPPRHSTSGAAQRTYNAVRAGETGLESAFEEAFMFLI